MLHYNFKDWFNKTLKLESKKINSLSDRILNINLIKSPTDAK